MKVWGKERKQIRLVGYSANDLRVGWSDAPGLFSGSSYAARFEEDRRLHRITARWDNPKLTLIQVIDCLGHPDLYIAYFRQGIHARRLELGLWYVGKGFIFSHSSTRYRESTPVITSNQRVERLIIVKPGELGEMIRNVYLSGNDSATRAYIECLLRPWPGSIEEMEVERLFENPRCVER